MKTILETNRLILREMDDSDYWSNYYGWITRKGSEGINETLGGWIIEQLNRMPAADDKVSFDKWDFIVVKVQSHRIERVRIVKNTGEEE